MYIQLITFAVADADISLEIIESGKSTIEIVLYVVGSAATLFGTFKGWGWFKSRKEKRAKEAEETAITLEENTQFRDYIKSTTIDALSFHKDILDLHVLHQKKELDLQNKLFVITKERDYLKNKFELISERCKSTCITD